MSTFIHETKVYKILEENGIKVPRHIAFTKVDDLKRQNIFLDNEDIVLKGIAKDLWHKSDQGALYFEKFDITSLNNTYKKMEIGLKNKYHWIEGLLVEKVKVKQIPGLPSEIFVSLKFNDCLGYVIYIGVGGVQTELWANEMKVPLLMISISLSNPEEALQEFKNHLIGKAWLGIFRNCDPIVEEAELLKLFNSFWKLARYMEKNSIELIEINPMAVNENGTVVPLDGVGQYMSNSKMGKKLYFPEVRKKALFNPEKIAIAGISQVKDSFGNKILKNILSSKVSKDNIKIIKPEVDMFEGVECFSTITSLKFKPVDILILALPAKETTQIISDLCEQGGGAQIVYIVAGGIGDGADLHSYGVMIEEKLNERRSNRLWAPTIIGPNSLGIVLSSKNLNTFFLSPKKLEVSYSSKGNIGLISQSGAFLVSRISNDSELSLKYGFCIGNQIDLSAGQLVELMAEDDDINVVGLYVEGFKHGDGLRLIEVAKNLTASNKNIVIYKGGKGSAGQKAAMGHTGAMAGDYQLQKSMLERAGIFVTENFTDFVNTLNWFSKYPKLKMIDKVAMITNAGYEAVSSADLLGKYSENRKSDLILSIDKTIACKLEKAINEHGLAGVVGISNPLDITPMANENAYVAMAKVFCESNADVVIIGIVPLTDQLETFDMKNIRSKAVLLGNQLYDLAVKHDKYVAVIVDSGPIFNDYRAAFKRVGLPVFNSTEETFSCILKICVAQGKKVTALK